MRETCGGWWLLLALTTACSSAPLPSDDVSAGKPDAQPRPIDSSRCDQGSSAPPEVASLTWPAPMELHLTGVVDAMNLRLDVGGAFRLFVDGCDFSECVAGAWTLAQDAVVLTPGEGESMFNWPLAGGLTASVRLTRDSPTTLRAEIPDSASDAGIWSAGLICPECCAGLGPSGLHACAGPLPASCPD